jgi:hypothetical protein
VPVGRVSSVDGIAARNIQRPAPIRAQGNRPIFARPGVSDRLRQAPQAASTQVPPTAPVVSPRPAPAVANSESEDDWQPTLAGYTPTETEEPLKPNPIEQFQVPETAPVPASISPESTTNAETTDAKTAQKRLKLPAIAWRKLLVPVSILVALVIVGGGIYAGVQYMRTQASPDTFFSDMITKSLSTADVQITKQVSGGVSTTTSLALSDPKNVISSATTTATIAGADFGLSGYGTAQNSYVSYTKLPTSVPPVMAGTIQNRWLQLRANGVLPGAIPASLFDVADPRYQAFGPFIFANLPVATRQKLSQFIITNHIYKYDVASVKHISLNGKKDTLFTAKLSNGYLQVANQSVASSEGFTPADVQRAIDALDVYKNASALLYVNSAHQLVRLTLQTTNQTVTYDYSNFTTNSLPAMPSTKLTWAPFAPTQLQMEAQVSASQTAPVRDIARQAALSTIQTALNRYFSQTGLYPSLANLNDQAWLAANMPGFDPDTTRDPQATVLTLLASAPKATTTATTTINPKTKVKTVTTVAAAATYGYIYQPLTSSGKACANEAATPTDQQCASYTLTAQLSTGTAFTLKSS